MPHGPHPDAPINPITIMLAPEFAVLAVLDEVVNIVIYALVAAHPRLADTEPVAAHTPTVEAATQLIENLYACRTANSLYRRLTLWERLDRDTDHTMPF